MLVRLEMAGRMESDRPGRGNADTSTGAWLPSVSQGGPSLVFPRVACSVVITVCDQRGGRCNGGAPRPPRSSEARDVPHCDGVPVPSGEITHSPAICRPPACPARPASPAPHVRKVLPQRGINPDSFRFRVRATRKSLSLSCGCSSASTGSCGAHTRFETGPPTRGSGIAKACVTVALPELDADLLRASGPPRRGHMAS
ncbi:uncharacterized protein SCHCODRAFT_02286340 [Schizophyllum commune H4-8]|uniref:uncharacterized protein n=1 Tax=Schizophyllum commune (strain H4-8 / FGSC 9210) TaxID=578458 RepID=UPI00215E10A3|nr:uncharacterized protein SCHCODRAFT_02286340 [Schizophyllum commune H4-8]KAI5892212.1 hypothetical protein SCHCODRAFT_02286340 [Schizophyllum commune H4-8]